MNKQSFFEALDAGFLREEIELHGHRFHVRTMTVADKDRFDFENARANGRHFRARLIASSVWDEAGFPVFDDGDLERLSARPASALEPLVEACVRVNRLGDDEREALAKK